MKKLVILMMYELKRIVRNRRLLLIVFSQPFIIAIIVGLLANHNPIGLKTAVVVNNPNTVTSIFVSELKNDESLNVQSSGNISDIQKGDIRAVISVNGGVNGISGVDVAQDPVLGPYRAVLEKSLLSAYNNTGDKLGLTKDVLPVTIHDATNDNLKYFDYYASALMVLLVILIVLNISSVSVTSERLSGTFERLAVTPYSKLDIIGSKALAHFLVGIFVLGVGLTSLYLIFSITIGNVIILSALGVLVVMCAVALGLFISAITKSVAESIQLAMYVFFIIFLTCGLNAPIETVHSTLLVFMKCTPFYYAVDAARRINMLDAGWGDISINLIIIGAFFLVFLALAVMTLRKESK